MWPRYLRLSEGLAAALPMVDLLAKLFFGCTYTVEKNEAIAAANTRPGIVQTELETGWIHGFVVIGAVISQRKERQPNPLVKRSLKVLIFLDKGGSWFPKKETVVA